jgi:hypothetical protein
VRSLRSRGVVSRPPYPVLLAMSFALPLCEWKSEINWTLYFQIKLPALEFGGK